MPRPIKRKHKLKRKPDDSKKESTILSILYWRRFCSRLIELQAELNDIKQRMAFAALKTCEDAINIFKQNINLTQEIERKKRRLIKEMVRNAAPIC